MSINFSTLQGLTIPEGVVTQITDASGNVLWALQNNKPIVLEVAKITSDTYAAETTYTGEQFILLNIYPKTNGTVSVTYGGLTKTITDTSGATSPNSQQVFFGTFNGVSDSVTTPASGTLTIEGDYYAFGCGSFVKSSKDFAAQYCGCITGVSDFGGIDTIRPSAFRSCSNLALDSLPSNITSIGDYAFQGCTGITLSSLPSGITSIGAGVFDGCTGITLSSLPSGITSIGDYAFRGCTGITLSSLPSGITSIGANAFDDCTGITLSSLPSSITSIEYGSFRNCTGITLSSLPSGITSIGGSAFKFANIPDVYGTGIAMLCGEITIPNSVTSIGSTAFCFNVQYADAYARQYLATVKILATTPPTFGGDSFGSIHYNAALEGQGKEFKVVVPVGCGDAYKAAEGWSDYADYIVEAS